MAKTGRGSIKVLKDTMNIILPYSSEAAFAPTI